MEKLAFDLIAGVALQRALDFGAGKSILGQMGRVDFRAGGRFWGRWLILPSFVWRPSLEPSQDFVPNLFMMKSQAPLWLHR